MKKIIRENGNLLLSVDGKTVLPAAYMSYSPQHADYDGFRQLGYRLFSYCVYAADLPTNEENGFFRSWEPGCFVGEETCDFTPLDRGMERVIGDCTEDVYVILRLNINMPAWWREKYPDELMHYSDSTLMQSVCSLQWREDACRYLQKLKAHIDASPYRKSIIGWQIAAMQTEEWIHPSKYRLRLERETPLLVRYRDWCRDTYETIEAVNQAWASDYDSFDQIPLPGKAQLEEKEAHGDTTPAGKRVREFYTCLNEAYADTISFFTRYTKELYDGDIFCGAFTGYIGQLRDFQGHSIMDRLLAEESIDFFASPFAYVNQRGSAVDWIYHAPMQTVTNEGKLWFLESDVRTCLTRHLADTRPDICDKALPYFNQPVFFGPASVEQSKANILRSFSKFFISQHAYWWFDMWGGWYNSAELMELQGKLYDLYREKVNAPVANHSEIAVVLDDRGAYGIPGGIFWQSIFQQLVELGWLGAPYDLLLLDRVTDGDIAKYKLFLLLSPDQTHPAYAKLKARLNGKPTLITGIGPDSGMGVYNKDLLQKEAAAAGVFVYSFGNIVYANEKYIAVTAASDGQVKLELPRDGVLEDVFTGECLTTDHKEITWETQSNLCRLFQWKE